MEFDIQVKLAVNRHFAKTGRRPSADDVAARVGSEVGEALAAYRRLRAQRVLVLETDGLSIREDSRRPQPDEMREIFAGLGLEGDFWNPR